MVSSCAECAIDANTTLAIITSSRRGGMPEGCVCVCVCVCFLSHGLLQNVDRESPLHQSAINADGGGGMTLEQRDGRRKQAAA